MYQKTAWLIPPREQLLLLLYRLDPYQGISRSKDSSLYKEHNEDDAACA